MHVSDPLHPGFFILRTYALWNKNRILLVTMLSIFFVSPNPRTIPKLVVYTSARFFLQYPSALASPLWSPQHVFALTFPLAFHHHWNILFTFTDATSPIPGIPGCYHSSTGFRLFIPFLLLSVFELGGWPGTHIYKIRADRCSPQDSWYSRSYAPYRAGG
jgi:hypothetical protein